VVNAREPIFLPGESLLLQHPEGTRVAGFAITGSGPGDSISGFLTFNNRRPVGFTGIEFIPQVNVTVASFQTSASATQILAAVNFDNQEVAGRLDITSSAIPPFFLAPNLVNPGQPFGAAPVA